MFEWLGPAAGIVLVDLVLSGDNAVVIGAAAAGLPRNRRLLAILLGGSGAVVLRILFALAATMLLNLHYLGIIGGIILLFIAIRILLDRSKEQQQAAEHVGHDTKEQDPALPHIPRPRSRNSFWGSILTILIADVTMSLDNVLAVAGLAKETPLLLIGGLTLSITILLIGSALVAELINRLPWLLDVACLVIAWTAAHILLSDQAISHIVARYPWLNVAIIAFALLFIIICDFCLFTRNEQEKTRKEKSIQK